MRLMAAAEKFKQVDMPSRVAESYWKIARNLDLGEDHEKATDNFVNAFAGYKAAAQKIPQVGDFYLDYAAYMKAWSEIQSAKLAHDREDYSVAMEHYEKASDLLGQSSCGVTFLRISVHGHFLSMLRIIAETTVMRQLRLLRRRLGSCRSLKGFFARAD